jgi:phytanoyl-CoA hydroxylase
MHAAAIEQFHRDGFTTVTDAVDPSLMTALRAEADLLVQRFTDQGHRSDDYWFFERSDRQQVLYRIHRLQQQGCAAIAQLYADGPLHTLAGAILGGPVRSTACAMIVKVPGFAARVPWHRDRISVPPHAVCNLSLFLDPSVPENGCLEIVPASHVLADDADVAQVCDCGPIQQIPAAAGDVVVHDVRLVHGSRTNPSGTYRRSIVIEFAPAALELTLEDG